MEFLTAQSEIVQQDSILMQMVEITNRLNVPVTLINMPVRVNGEAQVSPDNPMIWLSDRMNAEEMRFVFGHEIGHIVLHSGANVKHLYGDDKLRNRIEIEADLFSLELIRALGRRQQNQELNEGNQIFVA